jgi:uncharacterized protein (TIGR04255 family)
MAKLAPDYYRKGNVEQQTFAFAVTPGKPSPPAVHTARSIGIRLNSQSEKYVVQVLQRGLTVSRLEPYEEWGRLRDEASRVWKLYCTEFQPAAITRIAIRYINTILLPVRPDTRLEKIFTRPPLEPEGMSELLSSFLNRIVIEDPPSKATVVVTLASQPVTPQQIMPVILDIWAIRQAEFPVDDSAAWECLEKLRALKNDAFFGSLHEEQVQKYE